MLESRAKEHWSPFVRVPYALEPGRVVAAVNRMVPMEQNGRSAGMPIEFGCLGSSCAVWREDSCIVEGRVGNPRGHCGLVPRGGADDD